MRLELVKPLEALNKAYRKQSLKQDQIKLFKDNLLILFNRINDQESEENFKNIVADFLKDTYYKGKHEVNTKGRQDLVIYNDKTSSSKVGVIIEVKRPKNKAEMVTKEKPNAKAMHEVIHYYLQERFLNDNKEIKKLIVTNIYEWYIFDGADFEYFFFNNPTLKKQYTNWNDGLFGLSSTEWFYQEIAQPFIEKELTQLKCTYFNLKEVELIIKKTDKVDDKKLIDFYKILSSEHLLKKPFANDSNTLNKDFYNELLYIIGLEETKVKGKKLIKQKEEGQRIDGTLLENTINSLKIRNKLSAFENPKQFGDTEEIQLFSLGLELCITWLNRILFLKLLEGQLIKYHKGDKSYSFLNNNKIKGFDELNELFFEVLAEPTNMRPKSVSDKFGELPYLNSSLFEESDIEKKSLVIADLKGRLEIPISNNTVLKEANGKRITGNKNTLQYLFEFLDAYDFESDSTAEIQTQNKTIINASVLGLIFEKLNGYKDGSFFTPSFITMYMCSETIRKAVIQKFNEQYDWHCYNINDLYNKLDKITLEEANDTINNLKICDPAVGSGHFLVSALNEIITIKSELEILQDAEGKRLRGYQISNENDELIITYENEIFTYNYNDKESQRIQETLFHEKQTIIENCLFGVDINPKSVMICRLRLWIELLKNMYYTKSSNFTELETLPNIDINIKCGNSLVSRFALDADLSKALKKSKWTIDSYRIAVATYRNAKNKTEKREMESLILKIKKSFSTEIKMNDPLLKRKDKLAYELYHRFTGTFLFEPETPYGKKEEELEKRRQLEQQKIEEEIDKIDSKIEEIESNKIFENAFEWRFEFPEVLNDDGDFVGFDVVIGNPPYVYRNADIENYKEYFNTNYYNTSGNYDLYKFFIEQSIKILKENGFNSLITNSSFLLQTSFDKTRKFLLNNSVLLNIIPLGGSVFEEATVDSAIYILQKSKYSNEKTFVINPQKPIDIAATPTYTISQDRFLKNEFLVFDYLLNDAEYNLVNRLISTFPKIETEFDFGVGINTGYIKDELTAETKLDKRYHPMVPGTGVSKYGKIKTEGYIMYDKEFVKSKGKLGRTLPDEKFFTEPKILIVRTRNITLKERIIASIDYDKKYNLNRISNIISKKDNTLEGLLGVLNSKLFNWLYSKRYFDYEIKPIYLRNSPLCNTNDKDLNRLVKEVIESKKQTPTADTTALETQIDQMVYALYGLTEEEIKIVEEATVS